MSERVNIAARVDKRVSDALEEIARQRRQKTGADVRKADVIREALEGYVRQNPPKRQG